VIGVLEGAGLSGTGGGVIEANSMIVLENTNAGQVETEA
jgi:hypothetical protein